MGNCFSCLRSKTASPAHSCESDHFDDESDKRVEGELVTKCNKLIKKFNKNYVLINPIILFATNMQNF